MLCEYLNCNWGILGSDWNSGNYASEASKNLNFWDFFRHFLDFYSKIPENSMFFWKIGKILGEFGDFWWNSPNSKTISRQMAKSLSENKRSEEKKILGSYYRW